MQSQGNHRKFFHFKKDVTCTDHLLFSLRSQHNVIKLW